MLVAFSTATGVFLYITYITRNIPLPYAALPSFSRGLRAYKAALELAADPQTTPEQLRAQYLKAEDEFVQCYTMGMTWDPDCLGLVLALEKLCAIHMTMTQMQETTKEEKEYFRNRAEQEYLRTMELLVKHQGRMAPTLIRPMVGLSELYSSLGKHLDAQGLLIQSHAISLEHAQTKGEETVENTGIISQRLAEAYRMADQHKKALFWGQRALNLCEQYLGPEDVEVANILSGLCDSLCALGRPVEAKPLAERAVELTANAPPEFNLAAQYNLARIHLLLGDATGDQLMREVRQTAEAQGSHVIEDLLCAESGEGIL